MTDLTDLIARLEAASEGSREFDAAIRFVVAGDMERCNFDEGCYHGDCAPSGCGGWLGIHDERTSYPSDWRDDERLPRYTTSLDAALTLVAPRSLWSVCVMEEGPIAQVIRPMPGGGYTNGLTVGKATTAPLAICIAALKARSAA